MLKIRPAQLDALRQGAEAEYLRRVRHLLLTEDYELAAAVLDELDEVIARAFARARSHGVQQERSLTAFIRLWFAVGADFDRHPLVARYLDGPGRTPDDRFAYLMYRVAPWEWEVITGEVRAAGAVRAG